MIKSFNYAAEHPNLKRCVSLLNFSFLPRSVISSPQEALNYCQPYLCWNELLLHLHPQNVFRNINCSLQLHSFLGLSVAFGPAKDSLLGCGMFCLTHLLFHAAVPLCPWLRFQNDLGLKKLWWSGESQNTAVALPQCFLLVLPALPWNTFKNVKYKSKDKKKAFSPKETLSQKIQQLNWKGFEWFLSKREMVWKFFFFFFESGSFSNPALMATHLLHQIHYHFLVIKPCTGQTLALSSILMLIYTTREMHNGA